MSAIRKILLLLLFGNSTVFCLAQNVGISVAGSTPNSTALVDLSSTSLGFLVPRMTTAQITAIVAPATSLLVFNTTTNCMMFYTGAIWKNIACGCTGPPAAPGAITGPATPPVSSTKNVYFISPVAGATSYTWTVNPGTGTITAGQGTQAIAVSFGPAVVTYTICVTATNACGTSASGPCLNVTTSSGGGSLPYQLFTYTGALQSFTVPAGISSLTITAYGAGGGTAYNLPGLGAKLIGTFTVTPSEVLDIMVGGQGNGAENPPSVYGYSGSGGGSTYIWNTASSALPMMAAAGGGGSAYESNGGAGSSTNTPTNDATLGNAAGGAGGNGGTGGTVGAGAGWTSNGGNGSNAGGGQDPPNGGAGGTAGSPGAVGGWAGGGGCYGNNGQGGGGAGYNGGGGGSSGGGGGGGSYNAGTAQTNTTGVCGGDGFVLIVW